MLSPKMPLRYNDAPEQVPVDEDQDITRIVESMSYSLQKRDTGRPREADVHVKTLGFARGRFEVLSLPEPYCQGLFRNTGETYEALVRFSSASEVHEKDAAPDGRGMAVKLFGVPGARLILNEATTQDRTAKTQDFVMINHPVFFSRDAKDYAAIQELLRTHGKPFAILFAGGLFGGVRLGGLFPHLQEFLTGLKIAIGHKPAHPASYTYFSMAPILYGGYVAKYQMTPAQPLPPEVQALGAGVDAMHDALKKSLSHGSLAFDFKIQLRVSADQDLENATQEWKDSDSPWVAVGRLTLPQQDIDELARKNIRSKVAFNPWHALADHRPLGGMNRVRRFAYPISAKWRTRDRMPPEPESLEALLTGDVDLDAATGANRELIEKLYVSLDRHEPDAMSACYCEDSTFEDIAFRLQGRDKIHAMWCLSCGPKTQLRASFTIQSIDPESAIVSLTDRYIYPETNHYVVNEITSTFTFRDGLIASHRDVCDPKLWAEQAYGGIKGFFAGRIPFLRHWKADELIAEYMRNPDQFR